MNEDRWQIYYWIQKNNDQKYIDNEDFNNNIDDYLKKLFEIYIVSSDWNNICFYIFFDYLLIRN